MWQLCIPHACEWRFNLMGRWVKTGTDLFPYFPSLAGATGKEYADAAILKSRAINLRPEISRNLMPAGHAIELQLFVAKSLSDLIQ